MFAGQCLTENFNDIRAFVIAERRKVVSDAEWRFRMRGFGYELRSTDGGHEVARLPQRRVLGVIED